MIKDTKEKRSLTVKRYLIPQTNKRSKIIERIPPYMTIKLQ